jgi:catechol 2,3-dioxygenase-like lactoylglutathione lyase family enzyme
MSMINGLSHIAIVVPDLLKAASHYHDILGGEISQQLDMHEHGVSIVKLFLPGCLI